ncbi:MAG: hypothetical protein DRI23_01080 [Candidatus Cloacimonadota bacterium]|nr:MAG: hypothetical protein DRI23_01080 [Candidatus Cloacimonadota bacterium]RLC53750.1 MAG: hypothetical protein DRH79_02755 [Candidatus Cloacimonadota bacterium]
MLTIFIGIIVFAIFIAILSFAFILKTKKNNNNSCSGACSACKNH